MSQRTQTRDTQGSPLVLQALRRTEPSIFAFAPGSFPDCKKPPLDSPRLGNIVSRVFTPVVAKHSKSFSLIDCIAVGVDRMQRNFEPMQKQVEAWQRSELTDVTAKVVIYEAFVEGKLEAPKTSGPHRA